MRLGCLACVANFGDKFPYLFVGAFIEVTLTAAASSTGPAFPFLFGGAFIEAELDA